MVFFYFIHYLFIKICCGNSTFFLYSNIFVKTSATDFFFLFLSQKHSMPLSSHAIPKQCREQAETLRYPVQASGTNKERPCDLGLQGYMEMVVNLFSPCLWYLEGLKRKCRSGEQ